MEFEPVCMRARPRSVEWVQPSHEHALTVTLFGFRHLQSPSSPPESDEGDGNATKQVGEEESDNHPVAQDLDVTTESYVNFVTVDGLWDLES
jgi:hypothetical protein